MESKTVNNTFILCVYLSTAPLFFALFLALYAALDGPAISGYFINFARINSYIYAHSYGALLLVVFAGIQVGQTLNNQSRWYLVFNFALLWLAWFSYHSFADAKGMGLLLCCWLAALLIDLKAGKHNNITESYAKLKLKINLMIIFILLALIIINQ